MIQVENLRKEFKKTIKDPGLKGSVKALFRPKTEKIVAVDNVSFSVPKGEVLGFIGPNGAEVMRVPKICDSRRDIEALAALLNELQIEPCHFEDIIEDYLTDFSV